MSDYRDLPTQVRLACQSNFPSRFQLGAPRACHKQTKILSLPLKDVDLIVAEIRNMLLEDSFQVNIVTTILDSSLAISQIRIHYPNRCPSCSHAFMNNWLEI